MKRIKLFIVVAALVSIFTSCVKVPSGDSIIVDVETVWREFRSAPHLKGRLILGYYDYNVVEEICGLHGAEVTVDIKALKAVGLRFDSTFEDVLEQIKGLFDSKTELLRVVRYIEPNYEMELIAPSLNEVVGVETVPTAPDEIPDFEQFFWGIRKICASQAWDAGNDGTGIIVAILNTGIYTPATG